MNKNKLELQSEFEQHKNAALNESALDMWSVGQYCEHGYFCPVELQNCIRKERTFFVIIILTKILFIFRTH